ncbi:MAG: hypothetical protein H7Y86_15480 [Rhizobacter sp.]|nr:hypothetical protein [Ferruginibacter sp.]
MKKKKLLLLAIPAFVVLSLFVVMSSFTTTKGSFKVSCQFQPTTSNFADVEFENCNNLVTNTSVAAGSSWTPSLLAGRCSSVIITAGLPATHPAGTISIYKNGALIASHAVVQDQPASFYDVFAATFSDKFLVTW